MSTYAPNTRSTDTEADRYLQNLVRQRAKEQGLAHKQRMASAFEDRPKTWGLSPDQFRFVLALLLTAALACFVWMGRYQFGKVGETNVVKADRITGEVEYVDIRLRD